MKSIPANFEERLKLNAQDFADPERRRFYIDSSTDLEKLKGRIRRLSERDVIRQNAIKIAASKSLEIPAELMFPWEDAIADSHESTKATEVTVGAEDLKTEEEKVD